MDNEAIGARITKLRMQKGLTTTELSMVVGISQAQISRLENGKQGFRSATLSKIANALGVEPVALITNEESYAPIARLIECLEQEVRASNRAESAGLALALELARKARDGLL